MEDTLAAQVLTLVQMSRSHISQQPQTHPWSFAIFQVGSEANTCDQEPSLGILVLSNRPSEVLIVTLVCGSKTTPGPGCNLPWTPGLW